MVPNRGYSLRREFVTSLGKWLLPVGALIFYIVTHGPAAYPSDNEEIIFEVALVNFLVTPNGGRFHSSNIAEVPTRTMFVLQIECDIYFVINATMRSVILETSNETIKYYYKRGM